MDLRFSAKWLRNWCWRTWRLTALLIAAILCVSTLRLEATTVSTLTSDFRSDLGQSDTTKGRFTNTQVRRLLTRGTRQVATLVGEVEKITQLTLAASTAKYALPADYWGIKSVWIKMDVNYVSVPLKDADKFGVVPDAEVKTYITQYTIHADTIAIAPVQTAYPSGSKLYVNYYANPASLDSAAQTTELPQWTDNLVVTWAIFYANERDYAVSEKLQKEADLVKLTLEIASLHARPRPTESTMTTPGASQ